MYGNHPPSYVRAVVRRSAKRSIAQARLAAAAKSARSRLRWTQEQAAEAARLNIRHYQKLEEGSVNTTLNTVEALAKAFGVDVAELLRKQPD